MVVELSRRLYEEVGADLGNVVFEVHLEGKFPFAPPILCCLTHFTRPTIADGRDLLQQVIRAGWSPSYTISAIVNELPKLVRSCVAKGPRCALDVGAFPLETPLSLSTWEGLETMALFSCKEVNSSNSSDSPRILAVTETSLVLLSQSTHHLNTALPLFSTPLLGLTNLRRPRKSPNKLTFEWTSGSEEQSLELVVKEAERCVELVSANVAALKRIDVGKQAKTLKEEDVTQKALRKIPINEVLQAIAVYESNFDAQLNAELVNSLLGLYQQAIEYFSGVGDPRYDEFLDRMHLILSKEEVLAVLGGESRPVEKKETRKVEVTREKRELRQEIEDDLVLETPEIETLTLAPASGPAEEDQSQPSLP